MDVALAAFSVVQLVLAVGAAVIAFGLRKIFAGGIFESAWRVIGIAPIVYGLGQALQLFEATLGASPAFGPLASVVEVVFLVLLVSGFFMFASAWGGAKSHESGGKQSQTSEDTYAKTAKGALVFILGKNGAAKTMLYTGDPHMDDFESKLHGILGNGAATVIRHMAERERKEASSRGQEEVQ